MRDLVHRLTAPLMRLVRLRRRGRPKSHPACVYPYSCEYVAGPTIHRTGERPPRGEDSPLVRPYFEAHERQVAEERRRRMRGGGLRIAVYGVDVDPRLMRGRAEEVAAA
ncbi:hypothetical protein [Streptomyces sp. NBC_01727]|uniref:hypothetical protein n=1 Tax=unclassified Streptomyces TaxID=2593676 RepID=UPI002E0EA62F|nr:hypothetical protein OIE76_15185 [Streptomyces sp. NBC_01727]